MRPQLQISTNGCLQAVLASLLELPIAEVPNFADMESRDTNEGHPAWWSELQNWLKSKGYWLLEMKLMTDGEVTIGENKVRVGLNVQWTPLPTDGLVVFMGKTANGTPHAEIGRVEEDRFIPIFNPKQDGAGLTSLDSIGFLIPRDPATLVNMGRKLEAIERLVQSDIMSKHLMETIEQTARDGLGKPPKTSVKLFSPNGKRMDT